MQVHIYLSILMAIALINGLATAVYGRKFYGYSVSVAGKAHVVIGYLSLFFALVGVVSNGIRLKRPCARGMSIVTHCLSGAMFYLCSSKSTHVYVNANPEKYHSKSLQ